MEPLAYADRREPSPWFDAGTPLDGASVARRLHDDRRGAAWRKPYCVYVHVPFCRTICRYCALYTTAVPPGSEAVFDDYLGAMEQAIAAHPWAGHPDAPTTVHFGGGTPLSLGLGRFSRLVTAVRRAFGGSPACEWAIESTVSALDDGTIDALMGLGFTRVHLGIQTLDEDVRRRIGRTEPGDGAIRLIGALVRRNAAVSADLIIGIRGADRSVIERDLQRLHDAGIRMFSICELRERREGRLGIADAGERARHNVALWRAIWAWMDRAGLLPIHLGQFGRCQDDNRYYTHPARGEHCVALGPYAHGSSGDVTYGHLLLPEFVDAVRSGRTPISHGVDYGESDRTIRDLERALLAHRVPRSTLECVEHAYPDTFPALFQAWRRNGLLAAQPGAGSFTLSCEGSWFVGNMIGEARALARRNGTARLGAERIA